MSQRSVMLGIAITCFAILVGIMVFKGKSIKNDTNNPGTNWKWEDDWKSNKLPDIVRPIAPDTKEPKTQIIAGNYAEALKKSGELGKPVLAFLTADWCQYCTKMKAETLSDSRIKTAMSNYILVYVDTEKERGPVSKFNVTALPSYVITNYREDNLKAGSGFKNANLFSVWLDNPSMYVQPKNGTVTPPIVSPPNKKDERKILPRPRDRSPSSP